MKSSLEIAREIRNAIGNGVTERFTAAQITEARKPMLRAMDKIKQLLEGYNDEARPAIAVLSDIDAVAFNDDLVEVKE